MKRNGRDSFILTTPCTTSKQGPPQLRMQKENGANCVNIYLDRHTFRCELDVLIANKIRGEMFLKNYVSHHLFSVIFSSEAIIK